MKLFLILFAVVFSFSDFALADVANFSAFKVSARHGKLVKKIKEDTDFAKKYKTVLNSEIKNGPNFAGHYRIPLIGCGSSCATVAVINCETGEVYDAQMTIDGAHEWVKGDKIEFKKDSSLMVLHGCVNEDQSRCGHHGFKWNGKTLEPLDSMLVQ